MTNLEELLNKLIAKGWQPRNSDGRELGIEIKGKEVLSHCQAVHYIGCTEKYSLNDLCSLDSGLRQFVVKNGLYNKNLYGNIGVKYPCEGLNDTGLEHDIFNHTYWIMLSSIQENKEDFILSNIKLDD